MFARDSVTGQGLDGLTATEKALHVWLISLLNGESSQFNRLFGGSAVQGLASNQSASGASVTGACMLYAIRCTASSSGVITVYDGVTAAGKQIFTSLALTANTVYNVAGGAGELMNLGVYVTLVSGTATFDVLHVTEV